MNKAKGIVVEDLLDRSIDATIISPNYGLARNMALREIPRDPHGGPHLRP